MLGYGVDATATAAKGCPTTRFGVKFTGIGRPELRRVRAARHLADARRRFERLHRERALRRQASSSIRRRRRRFVAGREHHHRQRRALRRDERRSVFPRCGGRAVCRAQQRRACGRRRRRRPRLRVYDRRTRRRCWAAPGRNFAAGMSGGIAYVLDRARHRFERRCNRETGRSSSRSSIADDIDLVLSADSRARPTTRTASVGARMLAGVGSAARCAVRQGDAARLQASAERPGQGRSRRTRRVVPRSWSGWSSMGKPTGFIEIVRKKPPDASGRGTHPRLERGVPAVSGGRP